jgi:hypothetical protein
MSALISRSPASRSDHRGCRFSPSALYRDGPDQLARDLLPGQASSLVLVLPPDVRRSVVRLVPLLPVWLLARDARAGGGRELLA